MMTVGERILGLLKEKGITQKEFSQMTGIPQSTMSSWGVRKQNPGMDKLQIICDVLKIDPLYLISGTEAEVSKNVDYIRVYEKEEHDLIMEFRDLDKSKQSRLLGYLQALKGEDIR